MGKDGDTYVCDRFDNSIVDPLVHDVFNAITATIKFRSIMKRRLIPDTIWNEDAEMHLLKLLALIIFMFIALLASGYADRILAFVNPDTENCRYGRCKDSCNALDEVQKFGVDCIDSSNVCCVPKTKVISSECENALAGQPCGDNMVCDDMSKCVSRCEYCSRFPKEASCLVKEIGYGRNIAYLTSEFSCGCNENECQEISSSGLGTCVKGFCPNADPMASDYMCCNRPS